MKELLKRLTLIRQPTQPADLSIHYPDNHTLSCAHFCVFSQRNIHTRVQSNAPTSMHLSGKSILAGYTCLCGLRMCGRICMCVNIQR